MKCPKLIRSWVIPSLIASIVGALMIWGGIALVTVDNGSRLSATSHTIRERVITDKVNVYQKDGADFLCYLGEEYPLPEDKVIFVGETLEELKHLSSKKTTKTIIFDAEEEDYIYKEDTINYSYVIAKSKRSMETTSVICFIFGLMLFVFTLFVIPATFLVCSSLLED